MTKDYVFTQQDHAVSLALQQSMTAGIAWHRTATLPTSHSPFWSASASVVDTLASLATD